MRITLLVFAAMLLFARVALAQPPEVHARSDADVVGLGDTVHVTLQATSPSGQPIDPQLGSTGGLTVVGMSPSTSMQTTIANGVMTTARVLSVVWTLRAAKLGASVIGPITVSVDGTRYRTAPIRVRVVGAGQAPPRPVQPASPFGFDPFANFFNDPFGQMPQLRVPEPSAELPPMDPKLALDAPRGSHAFLHAFVDKTSAVVGEQITYTCYLYIDASIREPDFGDLHEAPANEFTRHSLQHDEAQLPFAGYANVGGRIWKVEILRKVALFPLATGDLDTGPMRLQVGSTRGEQRESENVRVHVTEPPVDGRPAGFVDGDVGQLQIDAEVVGREAEREGAIGVNLTVSGTGNVPASITPPERAGVEWLDPQTSESMGPQSGDKWGGRRTFRYVVRLHRSGDVDLGEVTLPFWNPEAKRYEVARAPLGSVRVKPGAAAATADAPPDPLPGLPAPRASLDLDRAPIARRHWTDAPAFWIALGAMPLAYFAAAGASDAVKRVKERRAARGSSPREEMRRRVDAAESASRDGAADARAIDAATIRAIEAATIATREVNVRAMATSDVARALEDAGAPAEDARAIEELYRACEASRYSASDAGADDARARWARAKGAIDRIAKAS